MGKHSHLFDTVASLVCNKPAEMSYTECFKSFGSRNPLCQDYGKCRLYEKTSDQFGYVLHPKTQDSFLRACPGSGKTEVVGMKAAYEIRRWDSVHAGIAVLTFTNNAADVIRERGSQFAGNVGHPHYMGTFDSWLHGYLGNPFAYTLTGYAGKDGDRRLRVVDASSRAGWLNAYRCNTPFVTTSKTMPIFANSFWCDPETGRFLIRTPFSDTHDFIDHESYFNSEAFQRYVADKKWLTLDKLKKDLSDCKKLFWKAGFVNYQDVEGLSLVLLLERETIRSRLSQRFPVVIVDECQDLSWGQLRILTLLQGQGSRVHLVGDLNQAIYAFKKVNPQNVESFVGERGVHALALQRNFRSVQGIVDLCGKLVDQGRVTGEPRVDDGPACVYFIYDPNHMSQLAPLLETYLRSRSIAVAESAILARGHATVNKLRPAASRVPSNVSIALATAVFLWTSADVQAMDEALKCVGRFIADRFFPKKSADSRHHYCPETEESALKWRLFLARVLDACLHNTSVSNVQQTWGEWAKAVRANFEQIVVGAFQRSLPEDRERFTFTAPRAKSSTTVVESLDTTGAITKPEIRITTIHQAKGQTFDAVMLVSSRTRHGDGGHWRYWLDKTSGDGEHARFAYVASSRPRRLLVWAIPKGDESSAAELEDLGFVAQ